MNKQSILRWIDELRDQCKKGGASWEALYPATSIYIAVYGPSSIQVQEITRMAQVYGTRSLTRRSCTIDMNP